MALASHGGGARLRVTEEGVAASVVAARRRLSTWCDREYWNDGNWRFSLRPDGVLVSPTGRVHVDAGGVVESNLLNAQGGMVHMFWAMP